MKKASRILSIFFGLFLLCTVLISAINRLDSYPIVVVLSEASQKNKEEPSNIVSKIIDLFVNDVYQASYVEHVDDNDLERIKKILTAPDNSYFVNKYAKEIVRYFTSSNTNLQIDSNDIKDFLIPIYGRGFKLDHSVDKVISTFTNDLENLKNEHPNAFVEELVFWYINIFLIAVCVLLAVILLVINKNVFAMFRFLSIPAIVDGILIIILANICADSFLTKIYNYFWDYNVWNMTTLTEFYADADAKLYILRVYVVNWLLKKISISGLITALCGLVLYLLGFKTEIIKSNFLKLKKFLRNLINKNKAVA